MFGTLRTLLAFNVVLLHIFNVPTLGNYSVSFFFLLSGFLMTLIMQESYRYSSNGVKVFWVNRFLRLYPTYLVILGVTIILIMIFPNVIRHPHLYFPVDIASWLSNITMIYPDVVPHRIEPRLVPPSWALTNELLFYLLISLGISKSIFRTMIWLFLSIGYFIGTYYFYNLATFRYSAIFASSLPFALGASLYWFTKIKTLQNVSFYSLFLVYLLFVLNAFYTRRLGAYFMEISIYINMILAIVLVYLLYNYKTSRKGEKLDSYLGYYSYPIYLSHYLVAMIYSGFVGYSVLEDSFKMNIKALPLYLLLLLLFCYGIVHLIDKPIYAYKRKLKDKKLY